MRRLAGLLRYFFKPRFRRAPIDDAGLPFTPDEFARLIRSGRREDMKILVDGLASRSMQRRARHGAPH